MSQYEIYKLMKKHPKKYFTTLEISERIKVNRSTATSNLLKLYRQGFAERKLMRVIQQNEKRKRHYIEYFAYKIKLDKEYK